MSVGLILVLFSLALQQDTGEQFYKFKKGTTWTYDVTEGGLKKEMTWQVVEEQKGIIFIRSEERQEGKIVGETEVRVWCMEDGYLVCKPDKIKGLDFRLYKPGSKKGDTWEGLPNGEAGAAHQGTKEIKVPAGAYKDVVQIQFFFMGKPTQYYFAPQVSVIKMETNGRVVELKKFEEGK